MAIDWNKVVITSDEDTVYANCGKSIVFAVTRTGSGGGGSVAWGEITGTLSAQTDLQNALDAKADTADLGDLATQDTVDYTTEVTNKPTLGTMASKDDAASDNKEYVRKNGAWVEASGISGVAWGDITGTLANQTDLSTALSGKQDTLTFDSTPTNGSSNPVTSDGVYDALADKAAVIEDYATSSSSTLAYYVTLSTNYFLTKVMFTRYPQLVYGETTTFWKTAYIYLVNSKSTTPKLFDESGTKQNTLYRYDDGYFYGGSLEIIYNRRVPSKSYCVITLPYKYIADYDGEILPNNSSWYASDQTTGTYPNDIPATGTEVVYTTENPRKIVKYYNYEMLTANTDATHYIGLSDTMDAQEYFQWFRAEASYTMTDGTEEAKDTATYIAAQDQQTASYVTDLIESELDNNYYTKSDTDAALDAKAPLASPALTGTPTAPTATVSDDSTQIATTAFVQDHAPISLSVTASAGSTVTKSDARITATMRVINCVFGTPANVTSDLSWTTSAGSVTFTGTFTGSTTITFELIECN